MATLAIAGGTPLIAPYRHRSWPDITEDDRRAVDRALRRGITAGPNAPELRALEEEYAAYVGVRHCVATNAGTASLHAALAAVGVRPGGQVIVPAYTFVASALAAVHQGADVVFCDVDRRSFNLDPTLLEALITDRTQAIMAVHIHGEPADLDPILAIARRHGVPVVEDNSQAHGIRYKGRVTGSFGQASGASINQSKNLSGGEGGLFTTDDEDHARTARRMVLYGEDVLPEVVRPYWSHGVGWNYRGQEMVCALARSQLRRLEEYNTRAQANAERLTAGLTGHKGIQPPLPSPNGGCSYWKYALRVCPEELGFEGDPRDLRDRVLYALRGEGVETGIWQPQPVPAQPVFRRATQVWHPRTDAVPLRRWDRSAFPVASELCDITLNLGTVRHPLYVQDPALMDDYIRAVDKVMANLDTVLTAPVEYSPRPTDTPC
ncbi:DegT/DnrJ/EryC1/StrS family aminotransferase [Streptomyces sp. NEAU-Y11]|uniref:DegT/DnrJ/EryC1/StrS family aminotransferase n=1 Tax=Streptomyces cucumeris TaxID=2962890 RepID=UPI0020C8D517|nr:DegT/DnrJ/EryC1/StrS family aminotransferase [Streptomyces sp. NEAU-Y11]MCP9212226.1 DegT/DnrJ/EryC1/StrS family aminotransferase [Streptomyces sp. NEAU-Y11]